MTRLMAAICMAGLMGTAAAAQTGAPHTGKTDQSTTANDKLGKSTTVTGCLTEGSEAGRYILTKATTIGDTTGRSYDLIGGNLKAHVGHRVEVTGRIARGKAMAKDQMMDKKQSGTGETRTALQVKSVRMHAVTCS